MLIQYSSKSNKKIIGNISGVDSKTGVIVGVVVGTSVIVVVAILLVIVTRRYNISLACNVERKG